MRLGKNDIPKLEEYWINYEHLKKQLKFREFELLHHEKDTNVGGGKSNLPSSPVEMQAVKLRSDDLYNNLKRITEAINDIYRTADDDETFIINARYFNSDVDCYEWEDIAHQLTKRKEDDVIVSKHAVLRKRNKIMQETAELIGWVSV